VRPRLGLFNNGERRERGRRRRKANNTVEGRYRIQVYSMSLSLRLRANVLSLIARAVQHVACHVCLTAVKRSIFSNTPCINSVLLHSNGTHFLTTILKTDATPATKSILSRNIITRQNRRMQLRSWALQQLSAYTNMASARLSPFCTLPSQTECANREIVVILFSFLSS